MASHTTLTPSELILETDKVSIFQDEHGMHGEVAPSKLAPEYLQDLLDDEDDESEHSEPQIKTCSESFDSSCSRSYHELEEWKKRVNEEERLSRIYKLKRTFSLRFDNRSWLHPHGTTNFDYKGIPGERKDNFEKFKNRARHENYNYLGKHPEIQAIISLAIKKLLHDLPDDPVKFLTDFFTIRFGDHQEFESTVEAEMRQISRYHVRKMRAARRINLRPCTAVLSEMSGESWKPEQDANYFKKLNIGALAQDFSFDSTSLKAHKKKVHGEMLKLQKKAKKNQPKSGRRRYCGCKDWKVGKENRETTAETEQEIQTATMSTLDHINDNLLTSSVAEEEEETAFGDGAFLGEMNERESEYTRDLTIADANAIASLLVGEMLGDNSSNT